MAQTKSQTIAFQLGNILYQYQKEVNAVTDEVFEKVANEAVQKLKNTSPKRTGKYARSWTVDSVYRREHVSTYWVHNAKYYRLTHLLENGHVISNGKGEYGRTKPKKHIEPVQDWAENELPAEIKRRLP